ncbi:MAG: curli assembly protein CsgF [Geminicoccaceae bacterium]
MDTRLRSAAILALLVAAVPAVAGELVYRPISPGFGGSPFNTDYVFGTAERAQSDPNGNQNDSAFGSGGSSPLENFTESLQARLLNQVSDDIVTAIFGEDAASEGRFEVAGTVIEFSRSADTINLVITDTANGQSTTIDVPVPRL